MVTQAHFRVLAGVGVCTLLACIAWAAPGSSMEANGTVITIPGDQGRTIEAFEVGDQVLAEDADGTWQPHVVLTTNRTTDGLLNIIYVFYSIEGDSSSLATSLDEVFVTRSGLLSAKELRPGMQLLDRDGQPATVSAVSVAARQGVLATLITDGSGTSGSTDGHVLLANGVQVGDYSVLMHVAAEGSHPTPQADAFWDTRLSDSDAQDISANQADPTTGEPEDDSDDTRSKALGDVVGHVTTPATGASAPTPRGRQSLLAFSTCLERAIADLEAAYPGREWPTSPLATCPGPRSFEIGERAVTDRNGHLHLTLSCHREYHVEDLAIRSTGHAGHLHAVYAEPNVVHVGSLTARPAAHLAATARCMRVAR